MGKRGGAGTEYKDKPAEQKKDGTVVKSYQRMPTQILQEWSQGQKRPKPEYRGVRSYDRSKCRFKVVLPDPKDAAKSLEFEANRDADTPFAAREEAAMVALLKLCPQLPLERKLPDGYRETWLEALGEGQPQAKAKGKAAAKAAAEKTAGGKEAAEQEKQAALARKAQEEQLEALQAEEQKNLCFEWERTGRCRRNGCRFDHPAPKPEDGKEVEAKESQWGNGWSWGDGWAEGSWSSAPLGAVHGHTSRAELEKGRREKKEAWAQEKNKRQAMQDMKRLANMDARVVLARRMRELISKALNLGAEYAEAKGEVEDVTDLEAAALAQLRAWGFKASAADAALLAARDAGGFGDEAADEAAERLRVWLCLHLPEHELPEAFAAGKGQFEVKAGRGAAPAAAEAAAAAPETAWAASRREFFGWVREALDAAMEDESAAEAMFASVEVVLEDDPGRTEEEEEEALDSALELMSAEGVQEPTLEEMRTRWGALRALAAAETSAVAEEAEAEAEAEASDGSEALGDHEEPEVVAEVEAPRPKPKGGTWFGWKADAAPKEVAAWKASGKGQKMQKAREALPAFKVKEELRQLLSSNQVLLIHGETGSGKTTQVGQYLLDSDTATPPRVVVTQPRRFAAVSVARRVAEERGEVVGENSVGYMVRGDTKMRYDRCQLLFCTLGVLLRRLIAQGEEEMFRTQDMTHLVLDEVHERSLDMDFVLTLLHHILPKRPKLKVLLMSATMDVQSLARLFSQKPPVLKIPGRTFPVEVMHLEEVEDLLGSTYQWSASAGKGWEGSEANERGDRKRDARPGPMDYALLADFILTLADGGQAKPWPEGAILVFMPGAGEISRLISTLERKGGRNVKALPLHGSLSGEQQRRCFEVYPASGPRKVIVSTNVAETSVTLPDVTIVVDTCRERRLTRDHDHTSLAPALLERFCAKDSLQQRRGRAGRVQKGVCFRLLPRSVYEKLPEATAPEIEALPLETLVLQVQAAGFAPEAFLRNAPTPPEAQVVAQARHELRRMGALSLSDGEDAVTALGRHLAALPCDVRVGRLVVLGAFLGVASAACSIAGWLSVRSPMPKAWQPSQEAKREALRSKAVRGQGGSQSDHCFWVAIMEAFVAAKSRKSFCMDLGLSLERMVEAESSRTQLLRGLRSLGFQQEADCNAGDWRMVRAAVVAGLYPQVAKVERPLPKFAEGLGGAIQISSAAREVRYWLSGSGGSRDRVRAFLHPSSLLFKASSYSCPYVMFSDKMVQQQSNPQHPTKLVLSGCTEASVYALLLFGGELVVDHQKATVVVDGWASFGGGSTTVVAMVQKLRQAIDTLLLRKVQEPAAPISSDPVAQLVVTLLSTDGLG